MKTAQVYEILGGWKAVKNGHYFEIVKVNSEDCFVWVGYKENEDWGFLCVIDTVARLKDFLG